MFRHIILQLAVQFDPFKAEFDDLDITSEAIDFDEVGGALLGRARDCVNVPTN